jgi:hypothetical protein
LVSVTATATLENGEGKRSEWVIGFLLLSLMDLKKVKGMKERWEIFECFP